MDFVLNEYVKEDVQELDDAKLPELLKLKHGSSEDVVKKLFQYLLYVTHLLGLRGICVKYTDVIHKYFTNEIK